MKTLVKGWLATSLLVLGASIASADTVAYAELQSGQFGTLDLNTGVFNAVGNTPVSGANGIAAGTNGMYYVATFGGELFSINPGTGAATTIGNSNIHPLAIAGLNGGLFELGSNFDLYSINAATGAATLIGPTIAQPSNPGPGSLTAGNGSLFMTLENPNGTQDKLYQISSTTGSASLLGTISGGKAFTGSGFIDGSLYAFESNPNEIVTIDTATQVGTVDSSFSSSLSPIFGATAVPEPASLTLSALALATLLGFGYLRRRKVQAAA